MNIAIDYDGTITRAPKIFKNFMLSIVKQGYGNCYIVTSRYVHELDDMIRNFEAESGASIKCTSRQAKKKYMEDQGIVTCPSCLKN